MNAVLVSIHPEWCGRIVSGEKTIEVRKSRPNLKMPFRCYIYCSMPKTKDPHRILEIHGVDGEIRKANGKVIGEFICRKITMNIPGYKDHVAAYWDLLDGKKLAVFAVGASPYEEGNLTLLKQRNFRPPMEQVPCFYGRGIWDLQVMSLVDRTMCKLLQKSVAKKPEGECQSWELALRQAGENRADWTHPDYLQPVLEWLEKN